jgi:type I restriction enzyme S subunit
VDFGIFKISNPHPPLPIQQEIVSILDKFTQLEAELEAELEVNWRLDALNINTTATNCCALKGKRWNGRCWEVGEFIRGSGMQKNDFTESGVGLYSLRADLTYYGFSAYKTKTFVSPELAKKLRKAKKGDIVIATTSENIEDVCKTVVWLGDEEIAISGETYIFKHNQNAKFIAYYLQTPSFLEFKDK